MLSLNLAAAAALALAAATPTPTPVPTPITPTLPVPTVVAPTTPPLAPEVSIVQVCALTSVEEINELLAGLTENDLVGALSPLLDVTTGDDESVEIDASLQLDDVRSELNCAPVDDGDPTPPPTTNGGGDDGGDDADGGQVTVVPRGAAETGGRPPAGR